MLVRIRYGAALVCMLLASMMAGAAAAAAGHEWLCSRRVRRHWHWHWHGTAAAWPACRVQPCTNHPPQQCWIPLPLPQASPWHHTH